LYFLSPARLIEEEEGSLLPVPFFSSSQPRVQLWTPTLQKVRITPAARSHPMPVPSVGERF